MDWFSTFTPNDIWFQRMGLYYPQIGIIILLWVFAIGACWGSFLNVCIWRIPRHESLCKKSSHCTSCGNPIRWYDNLPIISYLILRGHCRHCHAPYSSRYFLIELFCALMFTIIFISLGLQKQTIWLFLNYATLLLILIGCTWTDIQHRLIPNQLTYSGMIIALLVAVIFPHNFGQTNIIHSLVYTFVSGILPAVAMLAFAWICGYVFKQEAMGGGDIKLIAAIGMLTGLSGIIFTLTFASFAGVIGSIIQAIIQKKKQVSHIPFAPYLAGGAIIWCFCSPQIIKYINNLTA